MPTIDTPLGPVDFPEGTPPEVMEQAIGEAIQAERAKLIEERDAAIAATPGKAQAAAAGVAQGLLQGAAGFGTAVTEVGQAAADFLGLDQLGDDLGAREEKIRQGAGEITTRISETILGREATEQERARYGQDAQFGITAADIGAKVIAGMAGGAVTLGAKTAGSALGLGFLEGAIAGGVLSDSEATEAGQRRSERLGQVGIGAALGGVFGAFPAALAGGKNFVAKTIQKFSTRADEGFELAEEFGVPLSLGQASGNPIVRGMEIQAQGEIAQNLLKQQAEGLGAKLGARIGVPVRALDDVGEGLAQSIDDVSGRVQTVLAKSRVNRNAAWKASMDEADKVVGGAPIMRPHDLVTGLRKAQEEIAEQFGGTAMKSGPVLDDILKEAEGAVRSGGATAKQLQSWMVRLNQAKGSGVGLLKGGDDAIQAAVVDGTYKGQQQVLGGALSKTLKESIDSMENLTRGTTTGTAINMIKNARRQYGVASGEIRQIEREFLGSLGLGGTPAQVLNRMGNADPAVIRRAMKVVDDMAGSEVWKQNLRTAVFESAVDAGLQGAKRKGFSTGAMDVAAFTDAFGASSTRSTLAGLNTPAQEATARRGIDLARRILDEPTSQSAVGLVKSTLPVGVPEIAINVVSRDPGFATRLLAGAISRGKGADWLFYSPEGIQALQNLSQRAVKAPKWSALRNQTTMVLGSMFGADKATPDE